MRLHMLAVFLSCLLATVADVASSIPNMDLHQYNWPETGLGSAWYKCRGPCSWLPSTISGVSEVGIYAPSVLGLTAPEDCAWWCEQEPECKVAWFRWSGRHCSLYNFELPFVQQDFESDSTIATKKKSPVFSQVAASGECLASDNNDIGIVLGNAPHTIQVRLTFPHSVPSLGMRQWILNLGQIATGAHHWIWGANNVQFGTWAGSQIQAVDITQCTDLTTTHSGSVLKLYCNGVFLAETNAQFSIDTSMLTIGTTPLAGFAEAAFAGCISEVSIWSYEKSAEEVAQQSPPAFWETCRWETVQDQNLANTDETNDYLGYTCADDEILTGFGLTANENDVTKVQCCELGGHTSVVPNTCTFIDAADGDQGFQPEAASCDANAHMVFSGAYDKRVAAGDEITELLAGKCCEVKCDAQWCAGRDWGVSDQCETLSVDPSDNGAQNLVCPMGTLLTEIRDGFAGGAHGLQSVQSVVCCELDLIAQPTMAPSSSPTVAPTMAPSSSPTNTPSLSPTFEPSFSPTQAPTSTAECLLELHHAALTSAQYLDGIDRCLPSCDFHHNRRALKGRLLPEKVPSDFQ